METQDYAFEPGLIVGELLKAVRKIGKLQSIIVLLRNFFAGTIENKVFKRIPDSRLSLL